MNRRGPFTGVWSIICFNWPFYVAALAVLALTIPGFLWATWIPIKAGYALTVAGCLWFLLGSLGASYWVYDRSDLYRGQWIARAAGDLEPRHCTLCHAGFDDISPTLRRVLPDVRWTVLDHFEPERMTEASIHRARRLFPPTADSIPAKFNAWPPAVSQSDLVFGLLAIHEIRTHEERSAWFAQARRSLAPGGRIVIAEHTRDLANFLAFGPGFLHFHSPATWRRDWESAGLRLVEEFHITPFIRVFVLQSL